jgi:hypothetical protein
MSSRLRRLTHVRASDLVEAVAILATAMRVEYSLRRHDLPTTAARFGLRLGSTSANGSTPEPRERLPMWAARRARLTLIVMRLWPFGDTCLRKSLVMGNRLRSLSPQLFIGVRSANDEAFAAHAWLRITGIDIDPASNQYMVLDLA